MLSAFDCKAISSQQNRENTVSKLKKMAILKDLVKSNQIVLAQSEKLLVAR